MRNWKQFDPTGHWWQHSFVLHCVRRWTIDLVADAYRKVFK